MKDGSGRGHPGRPDFAAYRDNTPTGDPVKEARRPHMEEIFATLAAAGIARNDLYLAWDFTVASERNLTERLLFMRDDALRAARASAAPAFTVTTVENEVDANIFRRVTGTYRGRALRRLDDAAGAVRSSTRNGLPIHQATPQTAPFHCIIPRAALANAVATAVPARALDLRPRPARLEHRGQRRQRPRHGERAQLRLLRHQVDRHVERGHRTNAVSILQELREASRTSPTGCSRRWSNQLFLARLMIHPDGFVSDPAFQDALGQSRSSTPAPSSTTATARAASSAAR